MMLSVLLDLRVLITPLVSSNYSCLFVVQNLSFAGENMNVSIEHGCPPILPKVHIGITSDRKECSSTKSYLAFILLWSLVLYINFMILLQDNISHCENTVMNYKKVIYFVLIGESDQHKKRSGYNTMFMVLRV